MKYLASFMLLFTASVYANCDVTDRQAAAAHLKLQLALLDDQSSQYQDADYCLMTTAAVDGSTSAVLLNKKTRQLVRYDHFNRITKSPDGRVTAVFTSSPVQQTLSFLDQAGVISLSGKLTNRIDSESYVMSFTADSQQFLLYTYDDYMNFYYAVDLNQLTLRKYDDSARIREYVRQFGVGVASFNIVDEADTVVHLLNNKLLYFKNADLVWQKDLAKDQFNNDILAVGSKYIVVMRRDNDSVYYISRQDGKEYQIMKNDHLHFPLTEGIDSAKVRFVGENKLLLPWSHLKEHKLLLLDLSHKTITEQ